MLEQRCPYEMIWNGATCGKAVRNREDTSMPVKDTLYEWCVEQKKSMEKSLKDYVSGRWKIGEIKSDGTMEDQTEATKADLKRRIADLARLIAAYGGREKD